MSWSALRFQRRRSVQTAHRTRKTREHQKDATPSGYLLRGQDLERIFGFSNLSHIIALLERLRRMKGRYPGDTLSLTSFPEERLPGRNRHHLTPRCRRNEPYHGELGRNLLLIHIGRHKVWHKMFGVMTLEETIALLVRCREVSLGVWIAAGVAATMRSNWNTAVTRRMYHHA